MIPAPRSSPSLSRRRGLPLGAVSLVTMLALSACGGSASEPAASGGEPVTGGDLTIGTYLDPTCIDPQQIGTNASLSVTRQIVDSLTDQDPDTGEIVPWLADSWEINEDSSVFTFSLRDGVTFSDGTAFTASSVKANLDGIVALGALAPVSGPYLAGLTAATVLDESTIEIAFSKPNAQFLQATSNIALGMVSEATAAQSADERCATGAVGSGPFVLDNYTANDATVLSKRDGYAWGSPTWATDGEANLDTITFQVLPENSVRTGALMSGQIDAMDSVQQQDEASLTGGGFQIISRANPGFAVSILFNLSSPIASDPAVRQALMVGVNREDIVSILGPTGAETEGVLTQTTPGASDFTQYLSFDPEEAASILEDAGWAEGADGTREKDGVALELDFPYFFDGPVVELMQQQLAEIGVRLNISQITTAEFISALASKDFDATVGNLTRADIDVLRSTLTSAGANNYSMSDAELEELLGAQAAEPDAAARIEIAGQIQESVLENAYAVPLHALAGAYAVASTVQEFKFEASTRLALHDTWITE
jgi:peptide/nickel transport system substrate-binding protein